MSDRPIYKRNGKTISQIKVQKIIRKELRLSKEKYQKLYDITRNKLRNYERVTGAKKQSALQFLYNRAKYKARLRAENKQAIARGEKAVRYYKSNKAKFIESFTSKSSGTKTLTTREQNAINLKTENFINKNYGEFIKKNEYASKIFNNDAFKDKNGKTDYVKVLKALNEYANKRNDLKTDLKSQVKGVPIKRGERGSSGGTNNDDDKQAYEDIISKYGGSGL